MKGVFVNIILSLVLFIAGNSGKLSACEKADAAFDRLLFSVAIQEYEKCIKNGREITSLEKLANAYKILGNTPKALATYQRIDDKENMSIASKVEYAYLLLALKNKETALSWVDSCLLVHQGHPQLLNMRDVFVKEREFEENKTYQIDVAPFNSLQADYSPSVFDNKIVFSSTRILSKEIDGYTAENYSRLYYYDDNRQKVLPFASELNGLYNIGSTTFSSDGQEMFFTKNRDKVNSRGVATFLIWRSKKENGKWRTPLPAFDQKEEFNYVHPSISPNGKKLIFASDRDINNGLDLYLCQRKNISDKWSAPQKLPEYINSPKDEVFPVFLSDSVIVFSHETPNGLGGLDMYTSRFVHELWTDPVNLGKPFNSSFDDYGMMADDNFNQGYFTSTRDNQNGVDNIYTFIKKPAQFFDVTLEIRDSISGLPIQDVGIVYVQEDLHSIVYVTDSLGRIRITADKNKNAGLIIAYKGSLLKTIKLPIIHQNDDEESFIPIVYNSKDFIISGTTINKKGQVIPEAELAFTEEESRQTKKVTSDEVGEFEIVTKPNTSYIVTAEKEGHFTPVDKINTGEYSREKNMKIDMTIEIEKAEPEKSFLLKHIYYDFDKWNIRNDASQELDNLVSFLNQNPKITISLGSHTDSRGKDNYNLWLSQKRAESALAYLAGKNIDLSRIKAKGFGETILVNHCSNGANCSEEEHQANRRTEITILSVE